MSSFEDKVEQVREILENRVTWAREYAEEHDDYVSGYAHIVSEMSHDWPKRIEEWLDDNYEGSADTKELAQEIADYSDEWDFEAERNGSDYGAYSGPDCYLWGFKIEETEEQVDINGCEVLSEYYSEGILDDILDELENDFYIHRSRRRENVGTEEKPCYRETGRKLVNPYDRDYPTFELTVVCSGGWDFVVPASTMEDKICEALERMTESTKQFE